MSATTRPRRSATWRWRISAEAPPASPELVEVRPDGGLRLNFHEGQKRAWKSTARFVAVLAGTQGGKTSFGPPWLWREIRERGPGDYLVVTPTFPLLQLKALPEFLRFFGELLGLGTYTASPVKVFRFSEEGSRRMFGDTAHEPGPVNVYFGHARTSTTSDFYVHPGDREKRDAMGRFGALWE